MPGGEEKEEDMFIRESTEIGGREDLQERRDRAVPRAVTGLDEPRPLAQEPRANGRGSGCTATPLAATRALPRALVFGRFDGKQCGWGG